MVPKLKAGFKNYQAYISKCNLVKFILIQWLLITLCSVLIQLVMFLFSVELEDNLVVESYDQNSLLFKISIIAFIVPLFETFIYQHLPYRFFRMFTFFRRRKMLILLISSLFFGLSHYYGPAYIVWSFFMGIFLIYSYFIRVKKRDAFLAIFIIHLLINLVAVVGAEMFPLD